MSEQRIPAEVYPLASFLSEEMLERGWTTTDVALRMGGTIEEMPRNELIVGLILCVHKDGLLIGDKILADLARAFGVSVDLLRNLDAEWRKWPDRRVAFEPPERLFANPGAPT